MLVITIGLASLFFWLEFQKVLKQSVITEKNLTFEIEKGDSFTRISENLQQHGVKIKPLWFKFIAFKNQVAGKLKAGEYQLKVGLTSPELLQELQTGKSKQYTITFSEGWAFKDVIKALDQHPNIVKTIIHQPYLDIMKQIGSTYQHPEGWFFPDTYFFDKNASDESLLKRVHLKMQQVLAEQWQNRQQGLPLDDAYQALILASIVEKETGKGSERPIISGVFIRRLRIGMLLQTDPTIIYGMGDRYQGNIRKRDLLAHTPYNTYVNKGLTPTPIAMPGEQAIHAVLHPAQGKSLYFVAKGDGSHVFSDSYKEHNRAVDIYQRRRIKK